MDKTRKVQPNDGLSSDTEDDEDWFYDSIRRYNVLQMFEFETPKNRLFLSDEKNICVVGKDRRRNDEIIELQLPTTLTDLPKQGKLEKSHDLKQISGGFTTAPLVDIKVLYGKRKFVTSQHALSGVIVYQLGSDKSDCISVLQTITCSQLEPYMALNKDNKLALVTTSRKGITWIDLTAGKSVGTTAIAEGTTEESKVKAEFLSENTVAVCMENKGSTTLYDTRTGAAVGHVMCGHTPDGDTWTLSSSYSCENEHHEYIGLLSKKGNISIFDIRNYEKALCQENILNHVKVRTDACGSSQVHLRFSPSSVTNVSVSGFDDSVYVYEMLQTGMLSLRFTHDGHRKSNHRKCFHTTDHLWYGKSILSASEDKSVHCWEFV